MGDRRYTFLLGTIVLVGLALRIASARGGLWLDEAWSAQLAHDAGTPIGVFLNINHDNNHHLNSLWMQFVGIGAPPLLQRALAIVTGTLAIAVAARLFAPRSKTVALVAALLFAVSPLMVTMGSEARGYAPMTLALLVAILLIDRWLNDAAIEGARRRLAWCFALGVLSQLTMLFGCTALIGWVFWAFCTRMRPLQAARRTLALFTPALVTLAGVLGLIFGAAYVSPTRFQFGSYTPFQATSYMHAVSEMLAYAIGWPVLTLWLIPAALILVFLARRAEHSGFHWLAIVAFPVALAVLHVGNTGYARYYLVAGIALLLLLAEVAGALISRGGWWRRGAVAALAAMLGSSIATDADLIRNQRGDPDPAIAAMAARVPGGTTVLLGHDSDAAILTAAAAHARYPLTIVAQGCSSARFMLAHAAEGQTFPASAKRCGSAYHPIARAVAHGLSGSDWTLYERQP